MYADYHIHSEFSDDSRTPMEQQIEKAISLGLQEICFTDHVDYGMKKDWTGEFMEGKTQEEYNFRYYEEMLRVVSEFEDFDVLAHVDLISRYDSTDSFSFDKIRGILTEIFKMIIQNGKGIEINTSSWHYGLTDTMPSRDILKLYRSLGGDIITIGSDAHNTEYIGDHFEDARSILKEIGFTRTYTFEKHNPIPHEI